MTQQPPRRNRERSTMSKRRRLLSYSSSKMPTPFLNTPDTPQLSNQLGNYEEKTKDNNTMIRLYQAELSLLRRRRRRARLPATTIHQAASKAIESATDILRTSLSSSLVPIISEMEEKALSLPTISPSTDANDATTAYTTIVHPQQRHVKLLPIVSGVEISQVVLLSSSFNDDRSVQYSSLRLEGSLRLPPSCDSDNEPFSICLDVEHGGHPHTHTATTMVMTTPSLLEFEKNNCSIIGIRDCCIGMPEEGKGASVLWTIEEIDQITATSTLKAAAIESNIDDDLHSEFTATTRNFPLWLRNAQSFVEFAHQRARCVREWQQKYPALLLSDVTRAPESAIVRPDCIIVKVPFEQCQQSGNISTRNATRASAAKGDQMANYLEVQWSWSPKLGRESFQVVSANNQMDQAMVSPRKKQGNSDANDSKSRKQGQGRPIIPNFQDGLDSLLRLHKGDGRKAMEMFLEALSRKLSKYHENG